MILTSERQWLMAWANEPCNESLYLRPIKKRTFNADGSIDCVAGGCGKCKPCSARHALQGKD